MSERPRRHPAGCVRRSASRPLTPSARGLEVRVSRRLAARACRAGHVRTTTPHPAGCVRRCTQQAPHALGARSGSQRVEAARRPNMSRRTCPNDHTPRSGPGCVRLSAQRISHALSACLDARTSRGVSTESSARNDGVEAPCRTASSALFEGGTPLGVLAHDDARAPGRMRSGACDVVRTRLPGVHGERRGPIAGSPRSSASMQASPLTSRAHERRSSQRSPAGPRGRRSPRSYCTPRPGRWSRVETGG